MSRLAELIEELCPDGVEFRRLDELFATRNGYTPSRSDMSAWDSHDIPWFRMEDIRENGGILDSALTYVSSSAVKKGVLFPENSLLVATSATIGAHALITVPHLSNQRFTSLQLKDEYRKHFDYRFLYYYCFVLDAFCLDHVNVSSFPSVDMRAFRSFKFPFVPLAVQREIVRILDQFTTLEAELEAELEARRTQYEHYRNHLLSYESLAARGPVSWIPLREFGVWSGGGTPSKSRADYWDEGNIPWITPKDMRSSKIQNSMMNITDRAVRESNVKLIEAPSIALVVRSSILQHTFPVAQIDVDATFNQDMKTLVVDSDRFERRYIYYALLANGQEILRQTSKLGGSVNSLVVPRLMDFEIPVPALDEQQHIADLLDRFDVLVNDITSGLPAEIAARRAQYEHYRDRLLSFPEKVVSVSDAS